MGKSRLIGKYLMDQISHIGFFYWVGIRNMTDDKNKCFFDNYIVHFFFIASHNSYPKGITSSKIRSTSEESETLILMLLDRHSALVSSLQQNQSLNSDRINAAIGEMHPEVSNRKCAVFHPDNLRSHVIFADPAAWYGLVGISHYTPPYLPDLDT